MTLVEKRDGREVPFDEQKIYIAITNAMTHGSGIIKEYIAAEIASEIKKELRLKEKVSIIQDIEPMVFNKLIEKNELITARMYEAYRAKRELQREEYSLDEAIMGIVDGTNKDVGEENSNKNQNIAATQRDLIAGEYSRNYTRRKLMPINIMAAHDEGQIHFHDSDYFIQRMHNCQLTDLESMLTKGTVINGKLIESPNSFQTACTIATQIVQQIANGQYGGQTFTISHLAPFVRISYEKHFAKLQKKFGKELYKKYYDNWAERFEEKRELFREFLTYQMNDMAKEEAERLLKDEIKAGVQTIQYQINTFSTSNGQAPFLSIFIYLNENPEYIKETAMIAKEMFKQRILGMKNEKGVYVTPSFPKLLYVTDENNIWEDSEYFYITRLAAKCLGMRMVPDCISAKIMKALYDGEVFPCMGCRSFLSLWKDPKTGKYKHYGRFNQGVCTISLPDVGLSANKDMKLFWNILEQRLELCKQALLLRHEALEGTSTRVSPIHFRYGAIARLGKDETIDDLLHNGYSTISLGYAGLYECTMAMLGISHTTPEGEKFALEILTFMRDKCEQWKKETTLGFGLYGTPLESTTYKFAKCLKKRFGVIPGVTDHDYITNSYHVNVREEIDPFTKLKFESQFQKISSGGAVSYIESDNMTSNEDVTIQMMQFMYLHILYAEINGKFDYCHVCSHNEMKIDEKNEWYCPNCGNRNTELMNIARRACGYIGDNLFNFGKTEEIKDRYVHLKNHDLVIDEILSDTTIQDSVYIP